MGGKGREGRAENALNEELHLNLVISEMYATKVPFSSPDNKKYFQFSFQKVQKTPYKIILRLFF